jgi:hypothetical protein
VNMSAFQKSSPVSTAGTASTAVPSVPSTGPASPTRASASALPPSDLAATAAPRNGMKTGALASIPSRRSWKTCPSSCTSSSRTNPSANFQPQMRA